MRTLDSFPITRRWPPRHPDRLQLYSLNTPKGVKVSILLEELQQEGPGLPYEAHLVDFVRGDQRTPEFTSQSQRAHSRDHRSRRPRWAAAGAVRIQRHPRVPGRKDPPLPARRARAALGNAAMAVLPGRRRRPDLRPGRWFHKFDGTAIENPRPKARYVGESRRVLGLLEQRMRGREWIMGEEYSIADIAILGPVRNLVTYYGARELVGFDDFPDVGAWLRRWLERPAVQRGLLIPSRDQD